MAGNLREALQMVAPDPTDPALNDALRAVALTQVIAAKGGLDVHLGPGGGGLSEGEARRPVLARAPLRRPGILLLDEQTKGLDDETARTMLAGIRAYRSQAAILTASHHSAETVWARGEVAPNLSRIRNTEYPDPDPDQIAIKAVALHTASKGQDSLSFHRQNLTGAARAAAERKTPAARAGSPSTSFGARRNTAFCGSIRS